jgi:dipeptidyl aminopeptidase/acylaminoacyl peptidase
LTSHSSALFQASLTHFSSKLACGVANFGIAHWPSFLQNTAAHRRAARRLEYGDETDPKIREFLERISPLNHAFKISAPLSIAHGETDSRVTVEEAIRMQDIVSKGGVYTELMVCEKEGHGKESISCHYSKLSADSERNF